MTHDALRIGRVSLPQQIYHLTTVIAGRRPLLADFWLARAVIDEMRRLDADGQVESMAWVVMPDHVHWLAQLTGETGLAEVVRNPIYATGVGLLLFGHQRIRDQQTEGGVGGGLHGVWDRMKSWFQGNF